MPFSAVQLSWVLPTEARHGHGGARKGQRRAGGFLVTGGYEIAGTAGWKLAAGWAGLALGLLALYAALSPWSSRGCRRTVLPLGRRGPIDVGLEPGLRTQL